MADSLNPAYSQTPPLAVEMRSVVKRFAGVVANDGVDLAVRAGEVHALLGENGAGKSTLMNLLFGLYAPDEGEILVNGAPVHFSGTRQAVEAVSAWSTSISC
jgi:simple sugar transport system ATP-binding protein